MNIRNMINAATEKGFSEANAEAKACQDIVLKAIYESDFNTISL